MIPAALRLEMRTRDAEALRNQAMELLHVRRTLPRGEGRSVLWLQIKATVRAAYRHDVASAQLQLSEDLAHPDERTSVGDRA